MRNVSIVTGGSRGTDAATATLAASPGYAVRANCRVDRIKATLPMKRRGQPGEVADAILWLLSDEASYTTGAFIDLAGGK